ncbi:MULTISPECIES: hypothetical protein [Pseudomonas syringae group]|uniref:Uncharacterized protein n=1 Tax=Pseudomonas syringae pv. coriandricola TaxID=264453 RepID=A0A3M3JM97_9PSED|nr:MULTISPECIES: hypothetical protein [Pseudomonas syringae group]KOP51991.1 hypothetical protein OX88_24620 [Pseudomonas coronafaciens pv. porri]RMN11899.1 hypothetical protein ALQ65_00603 [Pseudomonas syringae pv. coriandricola]
MIAVIVMIYIAIILSGLVALTTYNTNRTQQLFIQSEKYVNELSMVKKSLLALSTTYVETVDDTTMRYAALPMGVNRGTYHTLPAMLLKQVNPLGKPYIYCPSGSRSDVPLTVTINGGPSLTYDVATSVLVKNGRSTDYVTGSGVNTLHGAIVLAYIISPNNSFKGTTNCTDVVFDESTQSFTVLDGRVEVITDVEVESVNLE